MAAIDRPASPAVVERRPAAEGEAGRPARPTGAAQPTPQADPLVERARGLIRRGDISGARLLLERAQARNAADATFLLAQTWDPAMLRRWNVRGLRADPDLARSLYAKAAGQNPTDERLLAATGR
jgi:TPR repeat protein